MSAIDLMKCTEQTLYEILLKPENESVTKRHNDEAAAEAEENCDSVGVCQGEVEEVSTWD